MDGTEGFEVDLHLTEESSGVDAHITGTVKPLSATQPDPKPDPIDPPPVDPEPVDPPVDPPPVDPQPAPVPPAVHPPGNDIRELLEMYPDKGGVVVVASGDYTAGSGVFPHQKKLVLVAEAPGQVGLNLEPEDLTLDVGSNNIAMCGFKSRNGTIVSKADDFDLWYHDGTFPIEKWREMYLNQLGGTDQGKTDQQKKDAIAAMKHVVPKVVWIGLNTDGKQLKNNRVFGSDIHDVGDDGIFVDKCDNALIVGHRIWNIDEKQYDPNVNPWRPNSDLIHNDAIQCPGTSGLTIANGYIQATCNIGGDNGSAQFVLRDLWVAGSGGVGFLLISSGRLVVICSVQNVIGFSNGMSFSNDDGWNTFMSEFCDDRQIIRWGPDPVTSATGGAVGRGRFMVPNRLIVQDLGGNSDGPVLSGFDEYKTGYMRDKLAPLNDPRNPGLLWRKANPYENWRQLVA